MFSGIGYCKVYFRRRWDVEICYLFIAKTVKQLQSDTILEKIKQNTSTYSIKKKATSGT